MKIDINYFAILQDERGLSSESVETTAHNPAELYAELKEKHSFSLTKCKLKVAVNDEFSDWEKELQPGDSVVFIPPVAGG
ncbi:MAG: MoaD/ThiS family protein [Lentisphaeraceae bacterium]|nr:MoaD/ThiS family protein [Lentisphaeraceae bacterium]